MNDLDLWAIELTELADRLKNLSADVLRSDEVLHDTIAEAIRRYDVLGEFYVGIEDQTQYPPEWEHLDRAVEVSNPNILLANMSGWVATGRWISAPLAEAHAAGWLEPALRRLAANVSGLNVRPGDFS